MDTHVVLVLLFLYICISAIRPCLLLVVEAVGIEPTTRCLQGTVATLRTFVPVTGSGGGIRTLDTTVMSRVL